MGFSKAATQLGILESQLYYWRNKHRLQQNSTEREQSLADENAKLKRLLAEQAEGLAISEHMTASLVCDALMMALFRRKHPKGVIVNTDRGSQYCSHDYQTLLRDHNLICSMNAKGCCYNNACSESFFHSLKVEAIHKERFETRSQMRETIFEYIEVDYNRQLLHSYLDYRSPDEFEIA